MNIKKILLILVVVLGLFQLGICENGNSPQGVIDSLKSQLKTSKGDQRFPILIQLAKEHLTEDLEVAESYMTEAESYVDEREINQQLFDYYETLARVKIGQSKYEESLDLAKRALNLNFEELDKKDHISIYETIGRANLSLGKTHKGHEAFFSSLQIADSLQLNTLKANIYNLIGIGYANMEDTLMTEKYFMLALDQSNQFNDSKSGSPVRSNLASFYMMNERYDEAEKLMLENIQIAEQEGNIKRLNINHTNLGSLYNQQKKYKKALVIAYYKKYTELDDSLISESRIATVAELEKKYESEKKEKEILALSNEKVVAEKRERTLTQAILVLFLGLIGIGTLFYVLRQNHRKNSIIQKKNLKIAADKIQLLEKGKEVIALESLVKGQENERARLAKELHDGLGGLLAISHSKLSDLEEKELNTGTVLGQARELVGEAYDQVRQISHNLMPLEFEKFGLVASINDMINQINKQSALTIDFNTYHFNLPLNNKLGLSIYRIVQEALTNVLKYAEAKKVLIELIQHEDSISLTIEDDGLGFDHEESTSGIGLVNMRNRAELLNGTFHIDSKPEEGTTISVFLPIPNVA